MHRNTAIIILCLICALTAAGCGDVELTGIDVRTEGSLLIVDTVFTGETEYTVTSAGDGSRIVLAAPGAVVSDTVPREASLDDAGAITGWFVKSVGEGVEVHFYLTRPFTFAHAASEHAGDTGSGGGYAVSISIAAPEGTETAETPALGAGGEPAAGADALARGITLYGQGKHDAALIEFNDAVEKSGRCPLACYYAARIRFGKKQYSRALANLEAAVGDSAGFTDAAGFRAYTLDTLGQKEEARAEWMRFIEAAGGEDAAEAVSADTIMDPVEYHAAVEKERIRRVEAEKKRRDQAERERLEKEERERKEKEQRELAEKERREKEERERLEAEERERLIAEEKERERQAAADSAPVTAAQDTAVSAAGETAGPAAAGDAGEGVEDIERKIRTDIRRGVYGVVGTLVVLIAGTTGVVFWIRRRTSEKKSLTFDGEIGTFMSEMEDEGDLDEESSRRIFEAKRIIISGEENELSPDNPEEEEPEDRGHTPEYESGRTTTGTAAGPERNKTQSPGVTHFLESDGSRQPITEEIKTLVTRMHREGRGIEEICRAADLTKTEVELIIAVRAKHMEHLIEGAAENGGEEYDADQLYVAIRELRAEGDSPRVIAKKLGVSTGEVNFAIAVLEGEERKRG